MSTYGTVTETGLDDCISCADTVSQRQSWRFSKRYIIGAATTSVLMEIAVYGLVIAVLPDLLSQLGAHDQQKARLTALMLAVYTGTASLSSPLGGILADLSASRKWPLTVGMLIYLASTIAFFAAPNVAVALLAKAVQGSSSSFFVAAAFALCMDTISVAEYGTTFGLLLSVADAGALLSPPLGGIIYVYGGKFWLVFVSLMLLVVAIVMIGLVGEVNHSSKVSSNRTLHPGSASPLSDEQIQPLLGEIPKKSVSSLDLARYKLQPSQNVLVRKAPILLCLKDSRFLGTIALCFVQSSLSGAFEAILPLEGESLFGFSPEKAGYLFIPLGVSRYTFGVVGGWAVDRFGPRKVGLLFYLFLVPVLLVFYFIHPTPRVPQIALMCCLLSLSGMCMAAVGTVSFVETGNVMDKYQRSNPEIFGGRNAFAALSGALMMVWAFGTSMGSLIAGNLRLVAGLGNTMAVFSAISFLGFIGSYLCLDKNPLTTE